MIGIGISRSVPLAERGCLNLDVAEGLRYIHSLDIPHGGLKGVSCFPQVV